jgi:hypothetical protein
MQLVLILMLALVTNMQSIISHNCSVIGTIESNSNKICVCKVKIFMLFI